MLGSARFRLYGALSAITVAAMWSGLASPAEATVSSPTTFGELSAAASFPACHDGDVAVMQAGFSQPNSTLNVSCRFTLDLNGQDLTLNSVGVGPSLTIKDTGGSGSLSTNSLGGPGIRVAVGSTLTIESGTVTAQGSGSGAGIGGFSGGSGGVNAGTVNITGGTVTATGGGEAAGIGGGTDSSGGIVNISGGTVTATGGANGAGIGSGRRAVGQVPVGGTVTISGGTVTATGGAFGAGIGGGTGGSGASVAVTGGSGTEVTASGGQTAIGSGTTSTPVFGSLSVAGLLRLPSGVLEIPNSAAGDEITVASNGRIEGTAADATAGAQIEGLGSITNHGSITLAAPLVTGGTPATTVKDNHHLVSFDTQGGSAAPADVAVFASSFDAGARTLPIDPTRTGYAFEGWNTAADGTGDVVTASSTLPGASAGTPVSVTAFAQWTKLDTTAPDTAIDTGPGGTNDRTADFTFSSEAGATFECRLDGPGTATGTYDACDSGSKSYSGLADGAYTFSVRATDTASNTDASPATATFNVDGTAPDTSIDSGPGSLTDGIVDFAFSSDDPDATFECKLDGPGAATGTFADCTSSQSYSGLADGGYTFSVRATDTAGNTDASPATESFTYAVPVITITTSSLPDGLVGKAYSATLTRVGGTGAVIWSIESGTLPAGLKLSAYGAISGTPTASGSSTFTVKISDSSVPKDVTTKTFTITVDPMTITSSSLPDGLVGKAYSATLKRVGGKGTVTWSVDSGALPAGLKLSTYGTISGTPSSAGASTFTAKITDSAVPKNTATKTFTITVAPMTITTSSLPDGLVGKSYSATLSRLGGKGTVTWSVDSGTLPAGLKLASFGKISGTPSAAGVSTFTVKITDSAVPKNTATMTLTIAVH